MQSATPGQQPLPVDDSAAAYFPSEKKYIEMATMPYKSHAENAYGIWH